jgi:hypothetical protein
MPRMNKQAIDDRINQGIRLRKAGLTYDQIAAQLNWHSRQAAHAAITGALAAERRESVDELRVVEDLRLDDMLRAIYAEALKGGFGAIDRVLKIMERRSKLWGLDAPVRTEVSGPEGGPLVFDHANVVTAIASRSGEYHLPPSED